MFRMKNMLVLLGMIALFGTGIAASSQMASAEPSDFCARKPWHHKCQTTSTTTTTTPSTTTATTETTTTATTATTTTATTTTATTTTATTATTTTGGTTGFTANLFIHPTSGTTTCVKNSSLVDYSTALASNNVCRSLYRSCQIAQGGTVGVKAGDYPNVPGGSPLPNGEDGFNTDCGAAGATPYDPNWREKGLSEPARIGWATFKCADGESSNVRFARPASSGINLYFFSNAHAEFYGGCFRLPNVYLHYSGGTGLVTQNLIFRGGERRIAFLGWKSHGAKNVAIYRFEQMPFVFCANYNDSAYSMNDRCRADVSSTNESWYGGLTTQQIENIHTQAPDFRRNSSGATINGRAEDGIVHDSGTKNPVWHTGCPRTLDQNGTGANGVDNASASHNIVFDSITCYRVNTFGIFLEKSDGVTIQNSAFGCPMDNMLNTGYTLWYRCVPVQLGIDVTCKNARGASNILIRYNSMATKMAIRECFSYNNVRLIGNVMKGTGTSCTSGVVYSHNAYGDGGCSLDANRFTFISDPFSIDNRTDIPYPPTFAQTAMENVGFDPTLTFGTKVFENALPSTGDFCLAKDRNGDARAGCGIVSGINDAGADSR